MKHHSDKSILDWLEEHPVSIIVNRELGHGEFKLTWTHAAAGISVSVTAPGLRLAVSRAIESDAHAMQEEFEVA